MKTPQQIRNEVEKEIKKLKKKVYKKLGTDKCPDKDYTKMDNWEEFYDGNLISFNAKLSILTEYDKSIKEMIEDLINSIWEIEQKTASKKNRLPALVLVDVENKITEFFSKIGDNSEVKE